MIESVVAVFIYENEIFYFQRQLTLRAFPGYHAFPGGKIDSDESEAPFETKFLKDYPPKIIRALCRELDEELRFNLEDAINAGEVKKIVYLGLAKPPVNAIGKFIAHHFKIVLNNKIQFTSEPEEALDSGWIPVNELFELYRKGKVLAVIPTKRVIEELSNDINTAHIDPLNVTCDSRKEIPVLELMHGIHFLFVISSMQDKPYFTNSVVVGDPAYIIDPSPYSERELEKLIYSIKRFDISGILITHHHQNHHKNVLTLAKKLNIHIKCSSVTHNNLIESYKKNDFEGVEVIHINEGDILTRWLDKDITVYLIPGHDSGQVGLAPKNMQWFFVGDIINAANWKISEAEIYPENGNKNIYLKSLKRIIDLNPAVIIPSHGMPLGSTHYLKELLKNYDYKN